MKEYQAREIFAKELEKTHPYRSRVIRRGMRLPEKEAIAVRAICVALDITPSPTLDEAAMGNRKNMISPDPKRSGALVSHIQSEVVSVSGSALDEAAIVERCARVARGGWERFGSGNASMEAAEIADRICCDIDAAIRREGVTAVGEGFACPECCVGKPGHEATCSQVTVCTLGPPATPTPNAAADALAAWLDGFDSARKCMTDDEAFCLTDDVAQDAWLDSATATQYRQQQQPGTAR